MTVRNFAMILGVLFVIGGIAGFVPGVNQIHQHDDPNLAVEGPGTGHLVGLFHVNVLHNLVHLAFGVIGIAAARMGKARSYCRFVAAAYGLLAVLGMIPTMGIQYTFGLIPIEGHDVWLHAVIAVAAAVFGWVIVDRREPEAAVHG